MAKLVAGKQSPVENCQILNLPLQHPSLFLGLRRPLKEGAQGLELVCLHLAPAPTHLDLEWLFLYTPGDRRVGGHSS